MSYGNYGSSSGWFPKVSHPSSLWLQLIVRLGLIYRNYRPVYYSPSSRSALAEAELVYKDDHVSHAAYVAFTLRDPCFVAERLQQYAVTEVLQEVREGPVRLLVWTTTPWTLTANMVRHIHFTPAMLEHDRFIGNCRAL